MYALWVVAVLSALATGIICLERPRQAAIVTESRADAEAVRFWAYQRTVADYVNEHKGFTGVVDTELLRFPDGYSDTGAWAHYSDNGVLYTWSTRSASKRALRAIVERGPGVTAGTVNEDGSMNTLAGFATNTVLPEAIPAGALVIIGN